MSCPPRLLVLGEIQQLMTCMRRNRKFKTNSFITVRTSVHDSEHDVHSLINDLDQLRWQIQQSPDSQYLSIDTFELVKPFVNVICSSSTSGEITIIALQSLHKFVDNHLFNQNNNESLLSTIHCLVLSITDCRYEATNSQRDEIVISNLLNLLISILKHLFCYLTINSLFQMFITLFRIYQSITPTNYSECLCQQSEDTLIHFIQIVVTNFKMKEQENINKINEKNRENNENITNNKNNENDTSNKNVENDTISSNNNNSTSTTITNEYYPIMLKIFEFLCTFCEIVYGDAQFNFNLTNNLPMEFNNYTQWKTQKQQNQKQQVSNHSINAETTNSLLSNVSSTDNSLNSLNHSNNNENSISQTNATNNTDTSSNTAELASTPSNTDKINYFPSSRFLLTADELIDMNLLRSSKIDGIFPLRDTLLISQLILTIFQYSDGIFKNYSNFIKFIGDYIFKFILKNCRSSHTMLLTYNLRIFVCLIISYREYYPIQFELILKTVYLRIISNKNNNNNNNTNDMYTASNNIKQQQQINNLPFDYQQNNNNIYDLKEIILESLLDLCHFNWFFREIYINYDSNQYYNNLFEQLFRTLCKACFPITNGKLTNNHILALKCLITVLKHMKCQNENNHNNNTNHISDQNVQNNNIINLLKLIPFQNIDNSHSTQTVLNSINSVNSTEISSETSQQHSQPILLNPYAALLSDLRCCHHYKHLLIDCIEEFNKKGAKKGLQQFTEILGFFPNYQTLKKDYHKHHQLTNEQMNEIQSIVELLRFSPFFDKVVIGQFLADPSAIHQQILYYYCKLFDFTSQSLDNSLRIFLESFRLPLEAQQIDRVMAAFALRYYENNSHLLANHDVVHTLAFSLIMLNTDAHNELIKNKMTLEQFISNNRGINAGNNVPRILLEGLYHCIKRNEIKMSGTGISNDINDALWMDLLWKNQKMIKQTPYLRLDKIDQNLHILFPSHKVEKVRLFVEDLNSNNVSTGYLPGYTIYRPPIILPQLLSSAPIVSSRSLSIVETSNDPTQQQAAQQLLRVVSLDDGRKNNPRLSTTSSELSVPSITLSTVNVDDDMFSQSWNPALAALSVVFDMVNVAVYDSDNSIDSTYTEIDDTRSSSMQSPTRYSNSSSNSTGTSSSPHLLDLVHENGILHHLHQGFTLLTAVASSYHKYSLVDRIVGALCKSTGLLQDIRNTPLTTNSTSSFNRIQVITHRNQSLLRFGQSYKSQLACYFLFDLIRHYSDSVRQSWNDLIQCLFQFQSMDIFPLSFIILDDFVGFLPGLTGRSQMLIYTQQTDNNQQDANNKSTVSSLFSTVSSFFSVSSQRDEYDMELKTPDIEYSQQRSKETIELCDLTGFIGESKWMKREALISFVQSLIDSTQLNQLSQLNWSPPNRSQQQILQQQQRRQSITSIQPNNKTKDNINQGNTNLTNSSNIESTIIGTRFDSSLTDLYDECFTDEIYYEYEQFVEQSSKGNDNNIHNSNNNNNNNNTKSVVHFLSSSQCSDCYHLVYFDIPIELRRVLLIIQLLTNLALSNRDRIDCIWPILKHFFMTILTSNHQGEQTLTLSTNNNYNNRHNHIQNNANTQSRTPPPQSNNDNNASNVDKENNTTASNSSRRSSNNPINGFLASPLPTMIIEAALVALLQLSNRLLHQPAMRSELFQALQCSLSLDLRHYTLSTQLSYGLHSILQNHAIHIHENVEWHLISRLLVRLASHRPSFIMGLKTVALLITPQPISSTVETINTSTQQRSNIVTGAAVSLSTFPYCIDMLTAYIRSRYCSPRSARCCLELLFSLHSQLEKLLDHIISIPPDMTLNVQRTTSLVTNQDIQRDDDKQVSNSKDSNTLRIMTPQLRSSHSSPALSEQRAQSQSESTDNFHTSNLDQFPISNGPHRLTFAVIWRDYCRPLYFAFRLLCDTLTIRISLINNVKIKLQTRFTTQQRNMDIQQRQIITRTLNIYTGYIGGFENIRKQLLTLLKEELANGKLADSISNTASHTALTQHLSSKQQQQSSSSLIQQPSNNNSDITGSDICSSSRNFALSCYWQLILDELLFPVLLELGHLQSLELEQSHSLTHSRTIAITILSKVFLRHLPQLLQRNSTFHITWLNVLKTMDKYMSIGINIANNQQQTSQTKQQQQKQHGNNNTSISQQSDEFHIMLKENVQETLKNMVLVMKASGVFDQTNNDKQHNQTTISSVNLQQSTTTLNNESLSMKSGMNDLWNLTWAIVDPFFPEMKNQLFPELNNVQSQQQQQIPSSEQNHTITSATSDQHENTSNITPANITSINVIPPSDSSSLMPPVTQI